jgi:hypothetical protein
MMNASPPASRRMLGILGILGLLLLISLGVLRSAVGTLQDSYTVEEPWHIVAGPS